MVMLKCVQAGGAQDAWLRIYDVGDTDVGADADVGIDDDDDDDEDTCLAAGHDEDKRKTDRLRA